MATPCDVIVVGLGAMGSAAACHLGRRGQRVIGLDRFTPPHSFGSSHGSTRIIREAYFEHPLYVPLVQRAYELWAELQAACGRELLRITGGLSIGRADGVLVSGAKRSAELHRLPHELLTPTEVQTRFPALRLAEDMIAISEPRAGILFPEACVSAHLASAKASGVTLRYDELVTDWRSDGDGVRVVTTKDEYCASQLLLTAGPWISSLLHGINLNFAVERQVLYWFEPRVPHVFAATQCPVHLWEPAPGEFFYGFPDLGDGVKVGIHHAGDITDPDRVRRGVSSAEVDAMRKLLQRFVPDADGAVRSTAVCLYTNTPDEHFFIDRHPAHPQVLIASPCSGHGFKFASVIGEVLADLLTVGRSPFDLSLFARR